MSPSAKNKKTVMPLVVMLSVTTFIIIILSFIPTTSSLAIFAAAAIPTSHTSSSYECIGTTGSTACNVDAKSTLKLRTMMTAAAAASKTSVTFTLINSVFNGGYLSVDCPTTEAQFTLPVHILVKNGSIFKESTAVYQIIGIVGNVFTSGSSIIIEGGYYQDVTTDFNTIIFVDSTSFKIVGASVLIIKNVNTTHTRFMEVSAELEMGGGSKIQVFKNTYFLASLYPTLVSTGGNLNVHDESAIEFEENTIIIALEVIYFQVFMVTAILHLETGGFIEISGNVVIFEVAPHYGSDVEFLYLTEICTLDTQSIINVTNNTFAMPGGRDIRTFAYSSAALIDHVGFNLNGGSKIVVSENNLNLTSVRIAAMMLSSTPAISYISSSSQLIFSNNVVEFSSSTVAIFYDVGVTLTGAAQIHIEGNLVSFVCDTTGASMAALLGITGPLSLSSGSSVGINNNIVSTVSIVITATKVSPLLLSTADLLLHSSSYVLTSGNSVQALLTSTICSTIGVTNLISSENSTMFMSGNTLNITLTVPSTFKALDNFTGSIFTVRNVQHLYTASNITISDGSTVSLHNEVITILYEDGVPEDVRQMTTGVYGFIRGGGSSGSNSLSMEAYSLLSVVACSVSATSTSSTTTITPFMSYIMNWILDGTNSLNIASGSTISLTDNTVGYCNYYGHILLLQATSDTAIAVQIGGDSSGINIQRNVVAGSVCGSTSSATNISSSIVNVDCAMEIGINSTISISHNTISRSNIEETVTVITAHNLLLQGTLAISGNVVVSAAASTSLGTKKPPISLIVTISSSSALLQVSGNSVTMVVEGVLRVRESAALDDVIAIAIEILQTTTTASINWVPEIAVVYITDNTVTVTGNNSSSLRNGAVLALINTSLVDPVMGDSPTLEIRNNTMTSTFMEPVHSVYLVSTATTPRLVADKNHLEHAKGTPAWIVSLANESMGATVITCGNSINTNMCEGTCTGDHPCVAPFPFNTLHVNDCQTASCGRTESLSAATQTLSASHNVTLSSHITESNHPSSTTRTVSQLSPTITAPIPKTATVPPTLSTTQEALLHTTTTSIQSTLSVPNSPTPTHSPPKTRSSIKTKSRTPEVAAGTTIKPKETCMMGCTDITQVVLDDTVHDRTTTPCTAISVPSTVTAGGRTVNFIITLSGDARRLVNTSMSIDAGGLSIALDIIEYESGSESSSGGSHAASTSPVIATLQGMQEGPDFSEVHVRLSRIDPTPLSHIKLRLPFPGSGFTCSPDVGAPSLGLPWMEVVLEAPPAVLSGGSQTAVVVVAASGGMVGPDLQTVAALGMLGCAPRGSDTGVEDNVRALVPVSLSETCEGAIWGSVVTLAVVFVLNIASMYVYARVKSVSIAQASAFVLCPSMTLNVWGLLQTGLLVCGGILAQAGNALPATVGLFLGALLPPLLIFLASRVVSRRCYRIAPSLGAPAGRFPRLIMRLVLPTYELDRRLPISQAFSTVVMRTRRVGCMWAALWVTPPVILILCVFARGDLCKPLYSTAAAGLTILAGIHIVFRPNRIFILNIVAPLALLINAALIGVGAILAYNPLNDTLQDASYMLAMAQTALTIVRIFLAVGTFFLMPCIRHKWFDRIDCDDESSTTSTSPQKNGGDVEHTTTTRKFNPTESQSSQSSYTEIKYVFEVLCWHDKEPTAGTRLMDVEDDGSDISLEAPMIGEQQQCESLPPSSSDEMEDLPAIPHIVDRSLQGTQQQSAAAENSDDDLVLVECSEEVLPDVVEEVVPPLPPSPPIEPIDLHDLPPRPPRPPLPPRVRYSRVQSAMLVRRGRNESSPTVVYQTPWNRQK